MKIRKGFISNSSSSSFIIIVKNGELDKEKILRAFDINNDNIYYPLFLAAASSFINEAEDKHSDEFIQSFYLGYKTMDEIIQRYPDSKEYTKVKEAYRKNWKVYTGEMDSGIEIQNALCHISFNYEDADIYIYKEKGY